MESRTATPLLTLGLRLTRPWPPSLRAVADWLTVGEPFAVFKDLLQEYLPEEREGILALPHPQRAAAFARAFEERYFPLIDIATSGELGMERLVTAIPVAVYGCTGEDYDMLVGEKPPVVVAALFIDLEGEAEDGVHITLLEKAQAWLSRPVLKRLGKGFNMDFLESCCEEHQVYKGLVRFGDRLLHRVPNYFLDATPDDIYGFGCRAQGPPNWDPEMVDSLTTQWEDCQDMRREENAFFDWLGLDIAGHTQELLDFLEGKWTEWQQQKTKA